MNYLAFDLWLGQLGVEKLKIVTIDKNGNLALLVDENEREQDFCLVINWKSIQVKDPVQKAKLERLIKASIVFDESNDAPLPPPVKLETESGRTMYIDAIPVTKAQRGKFGDIRSLLYFREVEESLDVAGSSLQQEYDLTPAEAAVAARLSRGANLRSVAGELHVSIWTVRSHLRSVFQKTNTHRQAELVALLTQADI